MVPKGLILFTRVILLNMINLLIQIFTSDNVSLLISRIQDRLLWIPIQEVVMKQLLLQVRYLTWLWLTRLDQLLWNKLLSLSWLSQGLLLLLLW